MFILVSIWLESCRRSGAPALRRRWQHTDSRTRALRSRLLQANLTLQVCLIDIPSSLHRIRDATGALDFLPSIFPQCTQFLPQRTWKLSGTEPSLLLPYANHLKIGWQGSFVKNLSVPTDLSRNSFQMERQILKALLSSKEMMRNTFARYVSHANPQ